MANYSSNAADFSDDPELRACIEQVEEQVRERVRLMNFDVEGHWRRREVDTQLGPGQRLLFSVTVRPAPGLEYPFELPSNVWTFLPSSPGGSMGLDWRMSVWWGEVLAGVTRKLIERLSADREPAVAEVSS